MAVRLLAFLGLALVVAGGWVAGFVIYRAAEVGELVSPLVTREYDQLTVIAVGTGSSYENPERLGPATAVAWGTRVLLVDAGRGVAEALRKAKIPVVQPDTVLLTNLMPENTIGLDDLLFTGWLQDRPQPLRVIGPTGSAALVDGLRAAHLIGRGGLARALPLAPRGDEVEVFEVAGGWSEELDGGVRLSAGSLGGGPLPALAYRFDRGRRSVVISGTGWGPDDLVDFAQGADMLVHEGVHIPPAEDLEEAGVLADSERLEREAALHTPLLQVGELASRAKVRSLVLVRLRPPPFFDLQISSIVSGSYSGGIHIPRDGDELLP